VKVLVLTEYPHSAAGLATPMITKVVLDSFGARASLTGGGNPPAESISRTAL